MPSINKLIYTLNLHSSIERWFDWIIRRKRAAMLGILDKAIIADGSEVRTAIDVGSSADATKPSSNFLAREIGKRCALTLFSNQAIDAAAWLEFPAVKIISGDARHIETDLGTFDLVMSNATIEHVGSRDNQARFLASCIILSNRFVFVTTPNRWHPLEFHTRLPFIHWLPKRWHRQLLRLFGLTFFSKEANLNLLTVRSIRAFVAECAEHDRIVDWRVEKVRFLGIVSNLLLIVRLRPALAEERGRTQHT